ncbi:unnamed protein product [Colias eurytheme]|nr:unnamed protein product [Colias eurytheme]
MKQSVGRLVARGSEALGHNGSAARRRNRIAPIAGLRADKGARPRPLRAATALPLAPDLCTTCLLFNESARRYLHRHYNKFLNCDSPNASASISTNKRSSIPLIRRSDHTYITRSYLW